MTLQQTRRVAKDGTVTLDVAVPRATSYAKDPYVVASPPRHVRAHRFAPGGIPRGVNQQITLPHDCENHLDGGAFEQTPQPKVVLNAPQ